MERFIAESFSATASSIADLKSSMERFIVDAIKPAYSLM